MEKKAKAEAKRTRRLKRKQGEDPSNPLETTGVGLETPDAETETPEVELETPDHSN